MKGKKSALLIPRTFMGVFEHTIDPKGRVFVPAKIRENLIALKADGLIVTRGFEKCLYAYTPEAWPKFVEMVESGLVPFKKNARMIARSIFGAAAECPMDRQGRIFIPGYLRDYAGLKREAVMVGVHDHLEIWDRVRWSSYDAMAAEQYEIIAEEIPIAVRRTEETQSCGGS